MLLQLFELASNKTLEHAPQTQARLAKLQGKTMALHLKSINQSLAITSRPEGLEFSRDIPETVDVTLKATIGAMVKIARDGMEDAELESGELEIIGDPIIGQRFALVISELDIDWYGLLSKHIGDGPAQAVTSVAAQAKEFTRESHSNLKSWLNDFIKNDLDIVVDEYEVDAFLDDIDTLRADADRLDDKVKAFLNKK